MSFTSKPNAEREHILEQLPVFRRVELPAQDLITEHEWTAVRREGFKWVGNLWGFIIVEGENAVVELRGKDRIVMDHVLAHGADMRFGYPVTESFQTKHRYTVHHNRPGVALYYKYVKPPEEPDRQAA